MVLVLQDLHELLRPLAGLEVQVEDAAQPVAVVRHRGEEIVLGVRGEAGIEDAHPHPLETLREEERAPAVLRHA